MADQTTQEAIAEIWQLFKASDAKLEQGFQETAAQFKETDNKLRRLEAMFGDQWGKLLGALVQPSALALFRGRGIQVHRLHQRSTAQRNGDSMEVDLILEDGSEVVVVEVKSSLGVEDVKDFLADLSEFTDYFPIYRGHTIYGAVAGLKIADGADRYAYRRGLFVLRVGGEGMVEILNDAHFQPRDFRPENVAE